MPQVETQVVKSEAPEKMPKLHVTRPRREHRSLHHAAILAPRRGHLAWVERDGWRTNKCLFCPAPISFAAAVAAIRRLTTSTAAATVILLLEYLLKPDPLPPVYHLPRQVATSHG